MEPVDRHPLEADVSFDGGDLDCGNGLLLLIRQHIDPLERGQLLEFRSTEIFVEEDFPAWCRMTGNDLISLVRHGKERSFLVCKGKLGERRSPTRRARMATLAPPSRRLVEVTVPRPRWMLQAIHEHLEGRLGEAEFEATADDAVRLAVDAQLRAGVNVVTDGFGADRVLLTPDCGFATFADNPVASARVAEDKLRAIAAAAELVRRG